MCTGHWTQLEPEITDDGGCHYQPSKYRRLFFPVSYRSMDDVRCCVVPTRVQLAHHFHHLDHQQHTTLMTPWRDYRQL